MLNTIARSILLLVLFASAASGQFAPLGGPRAKATAALPTDALQPGQQGAIAIVLDIPPGLHAQSHKPLDENLIPFNVTMEPNSALTLFPIVYPEGHIENYPALGKISVYTGRVIAYVPFQVKAEAATGPIQIRGRLDYQICDDKSCFPPDQSQVSLDTTIVPAGQALNPVNADLFKGFDPTVFSRVQTTSLGLFGLELGDNQYLLAFFIAFVVGIIFNLMPCVLPVVPLKAIGFYEASQHNRLRSLMLGLVFSLGIVASFAVLALLVVVFRKISWGQQFSNPYFLVGIIAILVIMALGMFGVFSVVLPQGVYRFTPKHDTYTGNFLFGILAAVLSTPCTAPMFLGLLIWATRQPAVLGTALVMMVGVGMAFPYLLLSAFPELARRFPRTGPWAELVKQLMGFLLLGVAVYFARPFIERIISAHAFWWTLFSIVAAAAAFLMIRTIQFSSLLVPRVAAAILALILIAPAFFFAWRLTRTPIAWQTYTPESLAAARGTGRPVLLEFTASWCTNCQFLEAQVLHDKAIVRAIKENGIIPLKVDVTRQDAPGWKLLTELNPVGAVPLTAIYAPHLEKPIQLSGVYTTGLLLDALSKATAAPAAVAIP